MAFRSRMPCSSHQRRKTTALRKYAPRVCGLRMWTVKYSTNRVTASSPAEVMIAGRMTPVRAGREAELPGNHQMGGLFDHGDVGVRGHCRSGGQFMAAWKTRRISTVSPEMR